MVMIIDFNNQRADDSHLTISMDPIERIDVHGTADGETAEELLANGLLPSQSIPKPQHTRMPGMYSDTQAISTFQQATDDVSGALSATSFGTKISSASQACSVPLQSLSNHVRRDLRNAPTSSLSTLRHKFGESSKANRNSSATLNPTMTTKRKKSVRKRFKGRLSLAKNLVHDATCFLEVGEDEKALKAYQQAIQIAGSEIARINVKIRTSASHNNVVQRSIKDRLGQDLRKIGVSIGKLRTKMAIVYERLGDYENAILCCKEAASLYKNLPNTDDSKTNNTDSSSDLVQAIEVMIQQLKSTREALRARDDILKELNECRTEADRTKNALHRVNCFIRMENLASAAMTVEVKILGACHPQVADSLQLLSTIALERSNPVRAIHFLDQAIAISQECLGDKHPRIGQYCLRLARICQSSGAETKAIELFEKAIQVLSHSNKYSMILGAAMNDLAVLHMRRGENFSALEKLYLALKHYTRKYDCFKMTSETIKDDIIQVHQNIALCYMAERNFGRAREVYAKVVELQSHSRTLNDTKKDLHLGAVGVDDSMRQYCEDEASIAQALINIGRASAAEGAHGRAIQSLKKALGMLSALAAEEGVKGETDKREYVEYKIKITKVTYCIAEESVVTGNLDDAMAFYTDSIEIFNLLGPNHKNRISGHVAHCHIGMSKVLVLQNDLVGAHAMLKKTLRNCISGTLQVSDSTIQAVKGRITEIEDHLKRPTNVFQL